MWPSWFPIFLALLQIVTCAPTARNSTKCISKNFDNPWILTDIAVSTPEPSTKGQRGYISFHFCDSNQGLELDTNCSGPMSNGVCENGDGGYVSCLNNTVAFKFDASKMIWVTRVFIDDW